MLDYAVASHLFNKSKIKTAFIYQLLWENSPFRSHFFSYLENCRKTNSNHFPVDDQEFEYSTLYIADSLYTCTWQHRLSFSRQIVRYRFLWVFFQ